MSEFNKKYLPLGIAALLGSLVTLAAFSIFDEATFSEPKAETKAEKKPLYWVAPMDPNYRRDKPGKSPMGMDLEPYYGSDASGDDMGVGTIKISPEVVNNLGVRLAVAELRPLHSHIKTVGYVQYDEDQLVHIHPRVEGWIEKLYVKASGDPVEKDQPLYEIYSPALVNAQEELILALERKNARLIQAAEDRLRALQLPKKAIRNLKENKKVKQTITFYAPQSGVIDNLNIREGFFAKPGTTLMSIGKLDQVWVEAEVFERQASDVFVGIPVTMTLAYLPGRKWQGKVDYVYPTLNPKTRTVKVRLRFENKDLSLKPNMFAQVALHAQTDEKTLLIPKEAVIRSGNSDRVVLALGNGRFKSIEVKVGRFDDRSAEILSGIEAGEKVVSSAQFLLDSESSKTSDFKRMNDPAEDIDVASEIWVEAKVNSLMAGHKMVNMTHQPIEAWSWPEMTMDFSVVDSVDFSIFKVGMDLQIKISKNNQGTYQIIATQPFDNSDSNLFATSWGKINNIMVEHRILNITRGPIKKWNRDEATLDFLVDKNIDISTLSVGQNIEMTFYIENGEFIIRKLQTLTNKTNQ